MRLLHPLEWVTSKIKTSKNQHHPSTVIDPTDPSPAPQEDHRLKGADPLLVAAALIGSTAAALFIPRKVAHRQWWLAVVATCVWIGFSAYYFVRAVRVDPMVHRGIGVATMMLAANLMLAWRLWQTAPDRVEERHYHLWRKAIQKPLEACAAIALFALLTAASTLTNVPASKAPEFTFVLIGLTSWAAFPGLVGTAGSDIAAWVSEAGAQRPWTNRLRHHRASQIALAPFMVALALALVGFFQAVPNKVPRLICEPDQNTPANAPRFTCSPDGTWPIQDPPATQKSVPYPTMSCSAPPLTRDPVTNELPASYPTFSCR